MKNNDNEKIPRIGIRFLAFLVDTIIIYVIWFSVVILPLFVRRVNMHGYNFQFEFMIGFFLSLIYFTIFYYKANGRTIGKKFFRLKIIQYSSFSEEKRLRLRESIIRAVLLSLLLFIKGFSWPIPLVIFLIYLQFWWTGLVNTQQKKGRFGWDYLSNSIVVKEERKNAS